ncbi:hypothetical protein [Streptomyces venezuelae]|uniref:hypothetical protein n=1 Tax=Streptomyces venezuelae TaxID=54571 RepID=UPI00342F0BC7
MTPTPRPTVWRFADRDTVRDGDGNIWHRGLRTTLRWAVPGGDGAAELDDDAVRDLLTAPGANAVFAAAPPYAYRPLPGRRLDPGALHQLDIRPATGATLHRTVLDRLGAVVGSVTGTPRTLLPGLRPADIRASLEGTAQRHPLAHITVDRAHGRLHTRYAIAHTLHTHTYILTTP